MVKSNSYLPSTSELKALKYLHQPHISSRPSSLQLSSLLSLHKAKSPFVETQQLNSSLFPSTSFRSPCRSSISEHSQTNRRKQIKYLLNILWITIPFLCAATSKASPRSYFEGIFQLKESFTRNFPTLSQLRTTADPHPLGAAIMPSGVLVIKSIWKESRGKFHSLKFEATVVEDSLKELFSYLFSYNFFSFHHILRYQRNLLFCGKQWFY